MLNRSAIVVKPKQPFLDWLHTADPTSDRLTLADLSRESTIYLIPEYDTEVDVHESCANRARRFSWSNWRAGSEIKRPGRTTQIRCLLSLVRVPTSFDAGRPIR